MGESTQEPLKDNRTLRQYLEDVSKIESQELYPEYSGTRKRILSFWEKALREGKVSLDDLIEVAIRKMREP